jgi:hypothetical protein
MMGDAYANRYFNQKIPGAGEVRQIAVTTAVQTLDLSLAFANLFDEGLYFEVRGNVDLYLQQASSATPEALDQTASTDLCESGGPTFVDTVAYPVLTGEIKEFVCEYGPLQTDGLRKYLHFKGSGAGIMWVSITSCRKTG